MYTACSNFVGRHRIALGLAGLFAASISGACSASLDFTECTEDADCDRFEGAEPLRCDQNTCVVASCSANSDCEGLGGSQVCGLDDLCVDALAVEGCEFLVLPGGEVRDSITLVGAVFDSSTAIGKLVEASFALAVEDFNAATTLGNGHQVGLVSCNSGGDLDQAREAAAYLAEEVGVPALLGPIDDDAFVDIAEKVSIKAGNLIFTMTPTATAPFPFSDSGVVWRTIPGSGYQGLAMRERISQSGTSAAMVFRGDNYGIGVYAAATSLVDGVRQLDDVSPQSLLSYTRGEDGVSQLASALELIGDVPDVIALVGGDEVEEQLKYLSGQGILPKKVIVSHAGLRGVQAAIQQMANPDLRARIELIGPLSTHPTNGQALYDRLEALGSNIVLGSEGLLAYDASMTTMLAMRAIGADKAITGPTIAQKMSRLTEGEKVSFGDYGGGAFVKAAVDALEKGNSIDVVGASGELGFIPEIAEPCGPFIAWGFDDDVTPIPQERSRFDFDCETSNGDWIP